MLRSTEQFLLQIQSSGANQVNGQLDSVADRLDRINKQGLKGLNKADMDMIATGLLGVGVAALTGVAQATVAYASFEAKMKDVYIQSGVTEAALGKVAAQTIQATMAAAAHSREMIAMGVGATRYAEAMTIVASQVPDASQAINVTNDAMKLQTAIGGDLLSNTTLLIQATKQYGGSMAETERYANILTAGIKKTSLQPEQLVRALGNAGGTASSFGQDIGSTIAVLDILTVKMGSADKAGENYSMMMRTMAAPSSKMRAEFAANGLNVDDFTKHVKTAGDLISWLNSGFKDSSSVYRAFGAESAGAAVNLLSLGNASKDVSKSVMATAEAINSYTGIMGDVDERMNSLQGKYDKFKAGFESFTHLIGQAAGGPIGSLLGTINDLGAAFLSMPLWLQKGIASFLIYGTAIGTLMLALRQWRVMMGTLRDVQAAVSGAAAARSEADVAANTVENASAQGLLATYVAILSAQGRVVGYQVPGMGPVPVGQNRAPGSNEGWRRLPVQDDPGRYSRAPRTLENSPHLAYRQWGQENGRVAPPSGAGPGSYRTADAWYRGRVASAGEALRAEELAARSAPAAAAVPWYRYNSNTSASPIVTGWNRNTGSNLLPKGNTFAKIAGGAAGAYAGWKVGEYASDWAQGQSKDMGGGAKAMGITAGGVLAGAGAGAGAGALIGMMAGPGGALAGAAIGALGGAAASAAKQLSAFGTDIHKLNVDRAKNEAETKTQRERLSKLKYEDEPNGANMPTPTVGAGGDVNPWKFWEGGGGESAPAMFLPKKKHDSARYTEYLRQMRERGMSSEDALKKVEGMKKEEIPQERAKERIEDTNKEIESSKTQTALADAKEQSTSDLKKATAKLLRSKMADLRSLGEEDEAVKAEIEALGLEKSAREQDAESIRKANQKRIDLSVSFNNLDEATNATYAQRMKHQAEAYWAKKAEANRLRPTDEAGANNMDADAERSWTAFNASTRESVLKAWDVEINSAKEMAQFAKEQADERMAGSEAMANENQRAQAKLSSLPLLGQYSNALMAMAEKASQAYKSTGEDKYRSEMNQAIIASNQMRRAVNQMRRDAVSEYKQNIEKQASEYVKWYAQDESYLEAINAPQSSIKAAKMKMVEALHRQAQMLQSIGNILGARDAMIEAARIETDVKKRGKEAQGKVLGGSLSTDAMNALHRLGGEVSAVMSSGKDGEVTIKVKFPDLVGASDHIAQQVISKVADSVRKMGATVGSSLNVRGH